MTVDVCFSPALYEAYRHDDATVVVVDVFRATTTIATALANGALGIRPVANVEEARRLKTEGWLVGAERNVLRCDFADFGNSPADYTRQRVGDRHIALTTTNGTRSIELARTARNVVTGAFVNLRAVADYCIAVRAEHVVVLCAGWNNRVNQEDSLFGGALCKLLAAAGYRPAGDAAAIALGLWEKAAGQPAAYLKSCEHAHRLEAAGLHADFSYCLTIDALAVLPRFDSATNLLTLHTL